MDTEIVIKSDIINKTLTGILLGIPTGTLVTYSTYNSLNTDIPELPTSGVPEYIIASLILVALWYVILIIATNVKRMRDEDDKNYEIKEEKYIQDRISKAIEEYKST